ncbi:MAG: hypothetical protein EOO38_02800 [Cytophagaceae bacterium]|jgi:hypothetical protein|nr:MAG: hypothetical protein EOO38_02800 [Cytophagaceae bacterium]
MSRPKIDLFLERVAGPRPSGKEFTCFCPSHPDRHRSFSLGSDEEGNVLIFCHAGCSPEAVLSALGLKKRDLFSSPKRRGN